MTAPAPKLALNGLNRVLHEEGRADVNGRKTKCGHPIAGTTWIAVDNAGEHAGVTKCAECFPS